MIDGISTQVRVSAHDYEQSVRRSGGMNSMPTSAMVEVLTPIWNECSGCPRSVSTITSSTSEAIQRSLCNCLMKSHVSAAANCRQ